MNARERAGFVAAFTCLVALELWWVHGYVALTRPLWLDEIHTLLLAERQSITGSLQSLAAGSDFNPPTLYLIYRFIGWMTGGLTNLSMRIVALTSVIAAVTIVYGLLRETFDRLPAAAGALAVWAQPVVMSAAFDARFYGPLLAGAAALIWLVRSVSNGATREAGWWLAVASVFVCTVHYFGVLSWVVTMSIAVLRAGDARRAVALRLIPGLAGPCALAACVPLYLRQRASLSVGTWIPAISFGDAAILLAAILLPLCLVAALVAWGTSRLLQRFSPPNERRVPASFGGASQLLVGQAVVPVVLIAASLFIQPFTPQRYAIVASLAAAPIVALAASRSLAPLRLAIVIISVTLSAGLLGDTVRDARAFDRRVDQDVAYAARAAADSTPLVVRRRHTLYPLLRASAPAGTIAGLFDEPSAANDSQLIAVDRDIARIHYRLYGFPRLIKATDLQSVPTFYFLEYDSTQAPPAAAFPGHVADRLDQRLYRFHLK